MLSVFIYFVGGTTLFMHTHTLEGHTITHSHPYLPSVPHTHSAQAFQYIAAAMMAVHQMCMPDEVPVTSPSEVFTILTDAVRMCSLTARASSVHMRGPPAREYTSSSFPLLHLLFTSH